jgi:uncharacterized membrane protein
MDAAGMFACGVIGFLVGVIFTVVLMTHMFFAPIHEDSEK